MSRSYGKIRYILKHLIGIAIASLIFFLVLPYPFERSKQICSSTYAYTCKSTTTTHWSWFGGYHIVPERLLPKESGEALEVHISKYYGVTYDRFLGFSMASVLLGIITYMSIWELLQRKKSHDTPPQ